VGIPPVNLTSEVQLLNDCTRVAAVRWSLTMTTMAIFIYTMHNNTTTLHSRQTIKRNKKIVVERHT